MPPAVEVQSLNCWATREVPEYFLNQYIVYLKLFQKLEFLKISAH